MILNIWSKIEIKIPSRASGNKGERKTFENFHSSSFYLICSLVHFVCKNFHITSTYSKFIAGWRR